MDEDAFERFETHGRASLQLPSTQIKPVTISILPSATKDCRRLLRSSFRLYEWLVVSGKWEVRSVKWEVGRRLLRSFLLYEWIVVSGKWQIGRRLLRSSFLLYEWIVVSGKWQIGRRLLRSFLLTQTRSSDCCQNHSVTAETRNKKPETRNQDFNNTQSPQKQETRNKKPGLQQHSVTAETRNKNPETRNKRPPPFPPSPLFNQITIFAP